MIIVSLYSVMSPGSRQHVILPQSVVEQMQSWPLTASLFVTDAGVYEKLSDHEVKRPQGARGAVLLACTSGEGWVEWRGLRHVVAAGDLVLLPEGEGHAYGANPQCPWSLEWAHFGGTEVCAWVEALLGAEASIPRLRAGGGSAVGLGVARIHQQLAHGYGRDQLLKAGVVLREILAELHGCVGRPALTESTVDVVAEVAEWMRRHYREPLSLEKLARRAGLSVVHFSTVFRRQHGYPPIDWLLRHRIREACQQLDAGGRRIEVVGRNVGFGDPYYFSRCFKRVMGLSPRAYQALIKG